MWRFVISLVAGALVVAGGWFGWQRGDSIAAATDSAARGLNDTVGTDAPAEGGESGPTRGSRASTDPKPDALGTSPSRPGPGGKSTASTPSDNHDLGRVCDQPAPTSAASFNTLFTKLDSAPSLEGADHGGSVALADGRRMFVFGDTIRDADMYKPFMVRNSVLVTNAGCLTPVPTGDDGPFVPSRADGVGYWPTSLRATRADTGTTVQVLMERVRGSGLAEFTTLGPSLATLWVPTGRMPSLVRVVDLGPDSSDPTTPTWGAAMWESGEHIYLFGTASNPGKTTFGWSLHVGRARPADLSHPERWEYWDGDSWLPGRPTRRTISNGTLIPADNGVSHVLSVFERGGAWYALSKRGDFVGGDLVVWRSSKPTGPWTPTHLGPLPNDDKIMRYMPLAHPDFRTASGRILMSYSQSPHASEKFFTNPELYRPQFMEIDLP